MKFLLVMKFWTDGVENSTRIRNIEFTLPKMVALSKFLQENGVDCNSVVYDFSPSKLIEGSIHRPYPLGEYKKAEKTNLIIWENPSYDYLFMFDCDAFFVESDFIKILDKIKNLTKRKILTFDLAKLGDQTVKKIESGEEFSFFDEEWSFAYSGDKKNGPLHQGMGGGLGGVYICDLDLIRENNGFDEKYVGWGGEDGDMMGRIMYSGKEYSHLAQRDVFPFHLPHFSDWGNEKYNKRFID
jgi:hypothetical protein